ncbi:MAG: class I SAM-dependent methyltransferase [Lachnospiraceae bacterium]|nr:class I SAM-dependent methyltransferase [Lachnospiraceae bacterium]
MDSYLSFSYVYDLFMDNVPYDEWSKNIVHLLSDYGIKDGVIVDLGCGTGQMTVRLRDAGFTMIGMDLSSDMLTIANEKRQPGDILYTLQDMREFELHGSVKSFVSFCDSMNYITSKEDLLQVFQKVHYYLEEGGLFLFDMNTPYKYENLLAENTFAETRDEGSFIWENEYDPESKTNVYDLTLYIKKDVLYQDGCEDFEQFFETHIQHCFSVEEVENLLNESGLLFIECLDATTLEAAREDSERVYFVATKKKTSIGDKR